MLDETTTPHICTIVITSKVNTSYLLWIAIIFLLQNTSSALVPGYYLYTKQFILVRFKITIYICCIFFLRILNCYKNALLRFVALILSGYIFSFFVDCYTRVPRISMYVCGLCVYLELYQYYNIFFKLPHYIFEYYSAHAHLNELLCYQEASKTFLCRKVCL